MESLLNIARSIRTFLYNLTSFSFFGIELDVLLHFGVSAILFGLAQPRLGTRRTALLLAVLIIAKEIADIFLKSQWQYIVGNIAAAPIAIFVDIALDLVSGVLGALAAWLWLRHRAHRERAAIDSPTRAA